MDESVEPFSQASDTETEIASSASPSMGVWSVTAGSGSDAPDLLLDAPWVWALEASAVSLASALLLAAAAKESSLVVLVASSQRLAGTELLGDVLPALPDEELLSEPVGMFAVGGKRLWETRMRRNLNRKLCW